jgi:hypothetical protein
MPAALEHCGRDKPNLIATIFLLAFSSALPANTLGLFPHGGSKSSAIESAQDVQDPQGMVNNPAGLANMKAGMHGEFGVGHLEYSYEHPRFDPVTVSLWTPVASAGLARNSPESSIAWGLAVNPSSFATLEVNGLPRRVTVRTESLNVKSKRNQLHLPIGIAWKAPVSEIKRLSFGFCLLGTYDDRTLSAKSLTDGTQLVDMESNGLFFRPIIGASSAIGAFDLDVSFMQHLKKSFNGKTTVAGAPEFETEQVDFDPSRLNTSLRLNQDQGSVTVNVNRVFASSGSNQIRDGINRKTTNSDVRDVNQIGAKVEYSTNTSNTFSGAYAYLPTIWGAGGFYVDSDGFSHHEIGHLFATFNAITVRNQALSWKRTFSDSVLQTTLFRSAGTQTIDGNGDNPGHYQIEFLSLTSSYSFRF